MTSRSLTDDVCQEFKFLGAGATRGVLPPLAKLFERDHPELKMKPDFDTVGNIVKRIDGGETPDMIVVSLDAVNKLIKNGKVPYESYCDIGQTCMGFAVRAGDPKPDISTVPLLIQALRDATHVVYTDPDAGGTGGRYVQKFLYDHSLGEVMSRRKLGRSGIDTCRIVAKEGGVCISMESEIRQVMPLVDLVGILPREVQLYTTYSAGWLANVRSEAIAPAHAFIRFLVSAENQQAFVNAGLGYNRHQ